MSAHETFCPWFAPFKPKTIGTVTRALNERKVAPSRGDRSHVSSTARLPRARAKIGKASPGPFTEGKFVTPSTSLDNHRDVAGALLIDTTGRMVLQRRDDVSSIEQPGKIGLFGGHRKCGETFLECVVREIAEEVAQRSTPERFVHLYTMNGPNPEAEGGTIHGEFYVVNGVNLAELDIAEGKLQIIDPGEVRSFRDQLSKVTRLVIERYLEGTRDVSDCE
jgi:ADP-ribose pyrophosphatase YjhB (NUDIX family)